MKTSTSQKVKIGIFTLVGFGVLLGGIFVIGSKQNLFSDTFSIHATFNNVGGLMIGNNIRFAGINVGTVENIVITSDTTVQVDMRVQSKVQKFLKIDAVASIGSDGLMGDKLVVISPGQDATRALADGAEVHSVDPLDFDKIIGKFTDVVDNAEIITASLASISSQISSGNGSLGKLIYTDDLQKGLVGTVNSAHRTMETANDAIKSVKRGTEGFSENMEAIKHNVLVRGYFRKKERAKQDSINAIGKSDRKTERANRKADRKADRKEARETKAAEKDAEKAEKK